MVGGLQCGCPSQESPGLGSLAEGPQLGVPVWGPTQVSPGSGVLLGGIPGWGKLPGGGGGPQLGVGGSQMGSPGFGVLGRERSQLGGTLFGVSGGPSLGSLQGVCVCLQGGSQAVPPPRYTMSNGYKPAPLDLAHVKLTPAQLTLVDRLAENGHNVWARDRVQQGWTYSTIQVGGTPGTPPSTPGPRSPAPTSPGTPVLLWSLCALAHISPCLGLGFLCAPLPCPCTPTLCPYAHGYGCSVVPMPTVVVSPRPHAHDVSPCPQWWCLHVPTSPWP